MKLAFVRNATSALERHKCIPVSQDCIETAVESFINSHEYTIQQLYNFIMMSKSETYRAFALCALLKLNEQQYALTKCVCVRKGGSLEWQPIKDDVRSNILCTFSPRACKFLRKYPYVLTPLIEALCENVESTDDLLRNADKIRKGIHELFCASNDNIFVRELFLFKLIEDVSTIELAILYLKKCSISFDSFDSIFTINIDVENQKFAISDLICPHNLKYILYDMSEIKKQSSVNVSNFANYINNVITEKMKHVLGIRTKRIKDSINEYKEVVINESIDMQTQIKDLFEGLILGRDVYVFFKTHSIFVVKHLQQLQESLIINSLDLRYAKAVLSIDQLMLSLPYTPDAAKAVEAIIQAYDPSSDLNNAILEWFLDRDMIHDDLLERFKFISEGFLRFGTLHSHFCGDIYAYHGTYQKLHKENKLMTYTFLSTTTYPRLAYQYARGINPYIYVFRLTQNVPYIIFNPDADNYTEVLLKYGCLFHVNKEVQLNEYTLVFCTYINDDLSETFFQQITSDVNIYDKFKMNILEIKNSARTDNYLYKEYKAIKYLYKSEYISENRMIRHILTEMLAAYIYRNVFNCSTELYELVRDKQNKYYLKTELNDHIRNYKKSNEEERMRLSVNEIIVDIIMSNEHAFCNFNTISIDGKTFRVNVNGALCYKENGRCKYSFFSEPQDHLFWTTDNMFVQFIKNTKKYVKLTEGTINVEVLQNNMKFLTDEIRSKLVHIRDNIGNDTELTSSPFKYIFMITSAEHQTVFLDFFRTVLVVLINRFDYYRQNCKQVLEFLYRDELQVGGNYPGLEMSVLPIVHVENTGKTGYMGSVDIFNKLIEMR